MVLCDPEDCRKRGNLRGVSETGEKLQRLLRFGRQPGELPDHEINDVIGISLGKDALEIPGPATRIIIEGEHALFAEGGNELNGEKRIARSLFVQQLGKRRYVLQLAAKSVRDKLVEMRCE